MGATAILYALACLRSREIIPCAHESRQRNSGNSGGKIFHLHRWHPWTMSSLDTAILQCPLARFIRGRREEEIRYRAHRYLYDSGPESDWEFEEQLRKTLWPTHQVLKVVRRANRALLIFPRYPQGWEAWAVDHVQRIAAQGLNELNRFAKLTRPAMYQRLDPRHMQAMRRSRFNAQYLRQLITHSAWVELVKKKHPDGGCDRYLGFDKIERVELDVYIPEKDPLDPFIERFDELPEHMQVAIYEAKPPLRTGWEVNPDEYDTAPLEDGEEVIDFSHI